MTLDSFLDALEKERKRQTNLWGTEKEQIERHGLDQYHAYKMLVFIEEVGEVARHILEHEPDKALEELVQVAAVCQAWAETL